MKHLIFILSIILFTSCSSNIQTATAKYYSEMDVVHCQAVLNQLPLHIPVQAEYDPKAPQIRITDSLWTNPCKDIHENLTRLNAVDKEAVYKNEENICTQLPGPWVASFCTFNNEPMPSLIRPGHKPSNYVPTHTYLSQSYSEPITVLVEFEPEGYIPASSDLLIGKPVSKQPRPRNITH